VLGMDLPTLAPDVVRDAFECLRDAPVGTKGAGAADVALGPSEDGGYYLLAARAAHPRLFREMTWSTSDVARETLARCAALGLRVRLLPPWNDVDDEASLLALRDFLEAAPPDVAPHTRQVLAELYRV
jgi:uncharacterized protein